MRFPQVVVIGLDDWLAKQLVEMVAERKWLLQDLRRASAWHHDAPRPTVLLVQVNVDQPDEALRAIAEATRTAPDVAVVAVFDVKLSDEARVAWASLSHELGCRLVLFPPLTKVLFEDAVAGLMLAAISRGEITEPPTIDLAQEGLEAS